MTRPTLYTDEHIDGRLIRALRRSDLVRAVDVHPPGTADAVHFQTAADRGRVLLTRDEDLLALAAEWQAALRWFPGLIFVHPRKFAGIGPILRALEALARSLETNPLQDRVHFL